MTSSNLTNMELVTWKKVLNDHQLEFERERRPYPVKKVLTNRPNKIIFSVKGSNWPEGTMISSNLTNCELVTLKKGSKSSPTEDGEETQTISSGKGSNWIRETMTSSNLTNLVPVTWKKVLTNLTSYLKKGSKWSPTKGGERSQTISSRKGSN